MSTFKITYVPQPDFYSCNQACLAMIAGIPIEEAVAVMKKYEGPGSSAFYKAFKKYKIEYMSWRTVNHISELPPLCILLIKFPSYNHTVVYYDGVYYDPEFGVLESYKPEAEITHYLELYIDEAYVGKNVDINVPQDFQEAFHLDEQAFQAFLNLTYPNQSKLINAISHYKNPSVRKSNIMKLLERLKQTTS